ncbi:MAG: helix-turn-helix domain-containing protein [Acidimicrobiales bacterium]|nr:helix-turn-helix domain-containing protein [Acidimicrobiales bacterium]MCB9395519.1 helix-turn-helix domain-containing protein [Acidimicrobiaceae bacterium]
MSWYRPHHPEAAHEHVLACRWTAYPTGRHRLVPDACMDLVCLVEPPGDVVRAVLCGPERSAWTFQLPTGVTGVGVRFRPGCASLVFGLDASTLVDRRVALAELLGARSEATIATAVLDAGSPAERALALERALAPELGRVDPELLGFVDLMTDLLVSSPRLGQAQLAAHAGVTPRQLHRRLVRTFGHGSARLGRLLRFQRFLAVREVAGHDGSIAELAAAAGYADQAHLARDCRAITGLTVRAFLAEWFPTFPDMSDPFKTSRPLVATIT